MRRAPTPRVLVLLALALGCVVARGDEVRKAADDPDPGFLEFLGSVDRLAEVNPDYLSQSDPKTAKPATQAAAHGPRAATPAPNAQAATPAPPRASPPPPPGSAPSGS
jgi:hypothetical protein